VFGRDAQSLEHGALGLGLDRGGAAALAARMAPLARGHDFALLAHARGLLRVVGARTSAGSLPAPATLPWHDQSVAGPMRGSAEDCALLLDAMIGFSPLSPLPACALEKRARGGGEGEEPEGLRLCLCAGHRRNRRQRRIEQICRAAAHDLRAAGASVDEIEINMSDGRDAFIALRAEAMAGNHLQRLERSASSTTISRETSARGSRSP